MQEKKQDTRKKFPSRVQWRGVHPVDTCGTLRPHASALEIKIPGSCGAQYCQLAAKRKTSVSFLPHANPHTGTFYTWSCNLSTEDHLEEKMYTQKEGTVLEVVLSTPPFLLYGLNLQ